MIADYEDLQESRQKIQKPRSIRKRRKRLSMCKRNSGLPNRPRPSLLAEGNSELEDDVEKQNGRTNTTIVVYEWSIYLSTS